MKAGWRLALYGAGLIAAFGAAFGIAHAVVPDGVVTAWTERGDSQHGHDPADPEPTMPPAPSEHTDH
ncbi:MAG: hypothetical protein QM606_01605 [Leucobacter sp.]